MLQSRLSNLIPQTRDPESRLQAPEDDPVLSGTGTPAQYFWEPSGTHSLSWAKRCSLQVRPLWSRFWGCWWSCFGGCGKGAGPSRSDSNRHIPGRHGYWFHDVSHSGIQGSRKLGRGCVPGWSRWAGVPADPYLSIDPGRWRRAGAPLKDFFLVVLVLAMVRFLARNYLGRIISLEQTAGLFFVLAFGMILTWRTSMLFEYKRLVRSAVSDGARQVLRPS